MEKIDIVLWAKNGALTLPLVLKRVEEIIPSEVIGKKIFVDDHSTDDSVLIAKDFGWSVFPNVKGGIGAGANLAFRQVTTECFISLEQDVYLAKNWWERIPKYLERNDVAVAQGWRISNHPVIKKIDEYSMERFRGSLCSIDNTIYKTRIIRALGGFPEHLKYPGVDAYIHQRVLNAGFRWTTDSSVLSIHFRMGGLREQIKRYRLYGMASVILEREKLFREAGIAPSLRRSVSIALFSPFRGIEIAIRKQCPQAIYYYPIIRFSHLAGFLKGAKTHNQ